MPRTLGVLLIAVASLLLGVFAWFCLVWLLSAGEGEPTDARALQVAMFIVSPHLTGWLVALGFAAIAFVLGFRLARRRRVAWLGFAADPTPPTGEIGHE